MIPAVKGNLDRVCDSQMLGIAARISAMAYSDAIMDSFPEILKFHAWYSSATAYLIRTEGYDVLVFRGSKEPLDFLVDISALPPVYYGHSWCHPGFAWSHASIWRKIRKHIDPDSDLLVTGHSLGGAMADKSVDFLKKSPLAGKRAVHMITFGKPNVHLKKGPIPYRGFLSTHLSVVSGSDLVTRVPRYAYRAHISQHMLYLANTGSNHIDPPREYMRADFLPREAISDHSMDGVYLPRVDKLISDLNRPTEQP